MKIRKASLPDLPALVALNRAVHTMHVAAVPGVFRPDPPNEMTAAAFKAALESPSSYWLVAEEAEIIAFMSAEFRPRGETWYMVAHHVCYISTVAVAPQYRRTGVARTLLAELKREADSRAVTQIELDVWAFNEDARQAFARLGFQPMMERRMLSAGQPDRAPPPVAANPSAADAGAAHPVGENLGRTAEIEPVSVEIRVLQRGDEDVLSQVAPDVFDGMVSPMLVREFLADPRHHIVVAVDAGTVVGFASAIDYIHPDKPAQLWVNEVGVALSYRQRGIGRKLIQALFAVGRAKGCTEAWVGTERSNIPAMRLYASCRSSSGPQDFVLFEFAL